MKNIKIEKLTKFFNDQIEWHEAYIESEDNLNNYLDACYESEIYLGELDCETKTIVEYLIENNHKSIVWNSCEGEYTHGIHSVTNEIASMSFGEIELQFSGLYDHETKSNCIYTDLIKGMSEDEIKEVKSSIDACIHNDCMYFDHTYERASLILNEDTLIENLLAA